MLILTQIANLSRMKDHYMTCAGSAFVIYCIVPKQLFTTPTTRHDYIDNKAKKIRRYMVTFSAYLQLLCFRVILIKLNVLCFLEVSDKIEMDYVSIFVSD